MKIYKYSEETGDIEEYDLPEPETMEIETCTCEANAGYNVQTEACKHHNPIFSL